MSIVAVIPARLGSQRLKQKNLLKINNRSLVKLCAEKCLEASVFDDVYVNSESQLILDECPNGSKPYRRDEAMAGNKHSHEEFIKDFAKNVPCDYLFQIHSIAPLLKVSDIIKFVVAFLKSNKDVGLCYEEIELECLVEGAPINFTFEKKQNSQDLKKIQRINWCMTGWKIDEEFQESECISYRESRYFHEVPKMTGIVVKTQKDFDLCKKVYYNNNKPVYSPPMWQP